MNVTSLTTDNFDQFLTETTLPVLVDFHAEWCGPCKMLSPVIDQVAQENADRAVVAKVDIDQAREIAERHNITSVPTLIVFKDGEPVVGTRGMQTKAAIQTLIEKAANAAAAI